MPRVEFPWAGNLKVFAFHGLEVTPKMASPPATLREALRAGILRTYPTAWHAMDCLARAETARGLGQGKKGVILLQSLFVGVTSDSDDSFSST